jgi:hypothetical protein
MDPKSATARGVSVISGTFVLRVVWSRRNAVSGHRRRSARILSIVPSVGAMLWAERIGPRLAIGWVMGVIVSMLGMYFSVN